jgi:hypothetical protein
MSVDRGHRGRFYYGVQGSEGTAASPTLPVGWYENLRVNIVEGTEAVRSAGTRRAVELEEGMWGVEWGFDIPKLQGDTAALLWLNYALATGSPSDLSWLTLGYGDSRNQWAVQDCRVDSQDFSLDNTGWVKGSTGGFGGKVATASLPVQTFNTSPGFAVHETVFSLFELASLRVSLKNNLRMTPVIAGPATTRDPVRKWDYLLIGPEDVSGTLGLYNVSGYDLSAPDLPSLSPTLTLTNKANPYASDVLTIVGLKFVNSQMTIPGADPDIEWEMPFLALSYSLAVAA